METSIISGIYIKAIPQIITSFPSCESIKEDKALNADPARLYNEDVNADYIAVVKNPRYAEAPEYQSPETRKQFIKDSGLRFLRPYQLNAVKALQKSVKKGNQRFLFEMATGERVIIVTGCINALVSRVSGTFIKYNSCIA